MSQKVFIHFLTSHHARLIVTFEGRLMSFLQFSHPIITLRLVDLIEEPVDSVLSVVCIKET